MQRNKVFYFLTNIVFFVLALTFVNCGVLFDVHFEWWQLVVMLGLFLLMHFARFVRMYFILLEDLIRPSRFLQLYIKTTFVSTLIPFKIGELYKMYCYGYETGSLAKGVIAVLIEKFFDALVLCAVMLPYALVNNNTNPLFLILMAFIIVVVTVYFAFEGSYKYLNTFLICRGGGKKSLVALKILEAMKKTYDGARRTLRGRAIILLATSALAWGLEAVLFAVMSSAGKGFNISEAVMYISDAFFGVYNVWFSYYVCLCAIVFIVAIVMIYGKKYFDIIVRKERK